MRIAIDCKNSALYGGGIAHWIAEVVPGWIESCHGDDVVLITPTGAGARPVVMPGARSVATPWYSGLPAHVRHGIYDNFTFPRAVAVVKPDLIFSPYHDVRMPTGIPSVVTVYDLCYLDAGGCYPWALRNYRLAMLKVNLKRSMHVITDSYHARSRLISALGLAPDRISVVPCSLPEEFLDAPPVAADIAASRTRLMGGHTDRSLLLYSGGIEYRKNLPGLLAALRRLWDAGEKISLLITGEFAARWGHLFPEVQTHPERVRFLGRLTLEEMRLAYEAVDAVVYPTLCEGFGRVCLEAMACGTPFACSSLDVLREVAGDYPNYFDPLDPEDIARAIVAACGAGRQARCLDPRYSTAAVRSAFLDAMRPIVQRLRSAARGGA